MPSYKTHLVGGTIVALGLLQLPHFCTLSLIGKIELCSCALLGSLFPDVDTKSKGQKIFYSLLFISAFSALLSGAPLHALLLLLVGCIPLFVNHRGIMHSFSTLLGLSGLISIILQIQFPGKSAQLLQYDLLFFTAGVISHLWLDRGFRRMIRS